MTDETTRAAELGTDDAPDAPATPDAPDAPADAARLYYTDDVLAQAFESIAERIGAVEAAVRASNETVASAVDLLDELASAGELQPAAESVAARSRTPDTEAVAGMAAAPDGSCVRCRRPLDPDAPTRCGRCGKLQPVAAE